jgi:hypothetical protein
MRITVSDVVLLAHASCGVLGCLTAIWVFFEALQASEANASRTRVAAVCTAIFMSAAWILGGYWYVHFYPAEKTLILAGPWPLAHNLFMETKEHLFFITGILALLLPVAARDKLYPNGSSRKAVLTVSALIVLTGLAVEGAGAVIDHGVKVALLQSPAKAQHHQEHP